MRSSASPSLVCNHSLTDGNKRLEMGNDEAYDLIYGIASGALRAVPDIADTLAAKTRA